MRSKCAHCGKNPVAGGKSGTARSAQKIGLCHTCYKTPTKRRARHKVLNITPRPGRPPGKRDTTKQRRKGSHGAASANLGKAFDGFGRAFEELGTVIEKELLEATGVVGDDLIELLCCVRAAIARTFKQRRAMGELVLRLKLRANEAAADLRRRIAELKAEERSVRREIGKLPRPEGEAYAEAEKA